MAKRKKTRSTRGRERPLPPDGQALFNPRLQQTLDAKTSPEGESPSPFRPRTKAEWLQQQFTPDHPEFPLDPEVVAAIPAWLPGEVPSNATELYAERRASRRARKTTKVRRPRRRIRLVPPPTPVLPEWCRYPGMDEQQVWNVKYVERRKWLESLGLDPFTKPLIRRVK